MSEFKAISNLLAVDTRGSPTAGPSLGDRHVEMDVLDLPVYVPESIRGYFDSTRLLWVCGYFSYPFFGWADLHARIAVERALRMRAGQEEDRTSLARLLHQAIDERILTDESLAGFHETLDERIQEKVIAREVWKMALFLGAPDEQLKPESFVKQLLRQFPDGRNRAAHSGVPPDATPEGSKETIKLARAIIALVFRSAPSDR